MATRLLTRKQFTEQTGISPFKQRQLEKAGKLRVVRLGLRTIRIPESELERLAAEASPVETKPRTRRGRDA